MQIEVYNHNERLKDALYLYIFVICYLVENDRLCDKVKDFFIQITLIEMDLSFTKNIIYRSNYVTDCFINNFNFLKIHLIFRTDLNKS